MRWLGAPMAFLALVPAVARAWPHEGREVHPGIIYRRFSGPIEIPGSGTSQQEIFVLYVDTHDPRISFVATRPDIRMRTLSSFAELHDVAAAINTNYFASGGQSCGLMVGEGITWTDSYHLPSRCSDSVGFAGRRVVFFDSFDILNGPPPPGVTDVATGMPTVVRDGVVVDQSIIESSDYPSHMASAHPRTGLCMHEDGRTLLLIVVDGRATGRTGMRGITFGRFARHVLGCRQAVMMDGGGSSTMYVRGEPGFEGRPPGIVNRTSDGRERVVCCHLGVRVAPAPDPPDGGTGPGEPDAGVGALDASTDDAGIGEPGEDAATVDADDSVPDDAFRDATRDEPGSDGGEDGHAPLDAREADAARRSAVAGTCACRGPRRAAPFDPGMLVVVSIGLVLRFAARRPARRCASADRSRRPLAWVRAHRGGRVG
ncbi:MAG: phosphodiester glycosidase family protein [Myxococcota bacterium]|nr:phosphodiester glycosidase family protein [Myxococcota bacterium]MDW8361243.1 phosphodiester glycosidase family protein [Myxococcales bacterium]